MRKAERVALTFGAACALGVGVAYLARPEDELAGIMQFHPKVRVMPVGSYSEGARFGYEGPNVGATEYAFFDRASPITLQIPGFPPEANAPQRIGLGMLPGYLFNLPSGRVAGFLTERGWPPFGPTCYLVVFDDNRPWYVKGWSNAKHRLGF